MKTVIKTAYAATIYLFLYVPLVVLGVYSLNASKYSLSWKGFTTVWYTRLLNNAKLMDAAVHSLTVACCSATLAMILGTLAALALHRYRFPGRKVLSGCVYVLIMSPDIIMGISLLVLYLVLAIPLGFWTLLASHITLCLPFVVVTVLSRLQEFDPHVIEAARDLGAREFALFRHVILPMVMPAVMAGWLLSFTLSLDDVMISFFTTGPSYEILPLKIYSMVRLGVKPEVNALCVIMIGITLLAVSTAQWLVKDKKP
jgi:spermidine/putrescine transport system permease protein